VSQPTPTTYPGLSVVIPAYRSPGTLRQVCQELDLHVAPLVAELEVIFVDDGSGDQTWATIESLAAELPWVRGITLLRNYGQHNAVLAGWRQARLPLVLTMDDDLQNPPDQVHLLLRALGDDLDLVYGRPVAEPQSLPRNLASRLTKRSMAAALGPDVYPRSSAFRLFRRDLVSATDSVQDPYISIDVLLSWATSRITDVPVEFRVRGEGRSGYTLGKLVRHALNMVTGYSTRPLRWVSGIGFVAALFGFALLAFVMISYLVVGRQVAGFTFLAAALSLFSGVQLLSLGVVGEYIGRMHFRSMGKPPYVIRAATPVVRRTRQPEPEPEPDNRSEAVTP
jgi:glycosyltransferase involved in cell wall biosynthesis